MERNPVADICDSLEWHEAQSPWSWEQRSYPNQSCTLDQCRQFYQMESGIYTRKIPSVSESFNCISLSSYAASNLVLSLVFQSCRFSIICIFEFGQWPYTWGRIYEGIVSSHERLWYGNAFEYWLQSGTGVCNCNITI